MISTVPVTALYIVGTTARRVPRLAIPTRWLALAAGTVLSAVLAARQDTSALPVMGAILTASLASSIAGFAFSAIAGAVLFHLSGDPVAVVRLMVTCSIANQGAMTWSLRRELDWQALAPFLMGGSIGLPLGIWSLLHADRATYTHVVGLFLAGYGLWTLLRRPVSLRSRPRLLDAGVGVLCGISGGAMAMPALPLVIWLGCTGIDKARQRALVQPVILIMQVAALAGIGLASGHGAAGFCPADALFVPAGLLGTSIGLAVYRRMSNGQFARAVNLLLVVSGLSFVL